MHVLLQELSNSPWGGGGGAGNNDCSTYYIYLPVSYVRRPEGMGVHFSVRQMVPSLMMLVAKGNILIAWKTLG